MKKVPKLGIKKPTLSNMGSQKIAPRKEEDMLGKQMAGMKAKAGKKTKPATPKKLPIKKGA